MRSETLNNVSGSEGFVLLVRAAYAPKSRKHVATGHRFETRCKLFIMPQDQRPGNTCGINFKKMCGNSCAESNQSNFGSGVLCTTNSDHGFDTSTGST